MKFDIKFRAWATKQRRMSYVLPEYPVKYLKTISGEWEVMQATNMEDKNVKRIYFGDIVQFEFHDVEHNDFYDGTAVIVETINGGSGILTDWDEEKQELYAVIHGGSIEDIWEDEDLWTIEVIGNIYENKNLIKEPQK